MSLLKLTGRIRGGSRKPASLGSPGCDFGSRHIRGSGRRIRHLQERAGIRSERTTGPKLSTSKIPGCTPQWSGDDRTSPGDREEGEAGSGHPEMKYIK